MESSPSNESQGSEHVDLSLLTPAELAEEVKRTQESLQIKLAKLRAIAASKPRLAKVVSAQGNQLPKAATPKNSKLALDGKSLGAGAGVSERIKLPDGSWGTEEDLS